MLRLLRCELLLQQRQSIKHFHRNAAVAAAGPCLTSDFLENSCGLSSEVAATVSKHFQLKSSAKALSVLALLKEYGFSGSQIAGLVAVRPCILAANPHKTLRPKMDFYRSVGVPEDELPSFVVKNSHLLLWILENRLKPSVQALSSVLQDDEKVAKAIRKFPRMLSLNLHVILPPRVEALQRHGVTQAIISRMFDLFPKALVKPTRSFQEILEAIEKTRIDPTSKMFSHAFTVFSVLPKPKWDRSMENYKRLGWSEEQVMAAFVKHPYCMACSPDVIKKKMEFFVGVLKLETDYVARCPTLLGYNFEKRTLRRSLVIAILTSKGFEKGGVRLRHLSISDDNFRRKYVTRHQNSVPEIVGIMDKSSKLELSHSMKKCLEANWTQYVQNG